MQDLASNDLAHLILRVSVAWVFLYAAWGNTSTAAAWQWTKGESALFYPNVAEPLRSKLALISAIIGMALMYFGGLSLLLGLEPRLGGLAVAAFSLMGMRVHAIRRNDALRTATSNTSDVMAWSAYGAHIAAGLKNWALIGAGLFITLTGGGAWIVSDVAGAIIGGTR